MKIHSTTGLILSNLFISKLAEYVNIPLSDCRGQGFDNGSNMVTFRTGLM